MGIAVQFFLKSPKAEKGSLMLVAYHKLFVGGRFKYYLPPIETKNWNTVKQRSRGDRDLNNLLESLTIEVKAIFHRQYIQDRSIISTQWMRAQIDTLLGKPPIEQKKEEPKKAEQLEDLFTLWEKIIDTSRSGEKPIAKSTRLGKLNTLEWLRKFSKARGWKPSLMNFDRDFYFGFCDYLSENGINVVGKHIKEVKALLRECEERNIAVNQDFKKKFFKVQFEPKEDIYLTSGEIEKIAQVKLNGALSDCRDTFVMACFCGLRHSDWDKIHPDNVVMVNGKEYLALPTHKTGVPVRIPLHPTIKEIFARHQNRPPRVPSNPITNANLKEIAKAAELGKVFVNGEVTEKWKEVCTHTARRTFATNAYLTGMPTQLIMALTGHKKESSFRAYLKLGSEEMAQLASEAKFFAGTADNVMRVA